MMRAIGVRAALVSLVILAVWSLGQAEEAGQTQATVALRAEGLLLARCAVCHSTDLITQQRIDRTRWEVTIKKMKHWGAEITDEDAAVLVEYLSVRYHPNAPAQEPVPAAEPLRASEAPMSERPSGMAQRGESVYAHNCQACHGTGARGGMGPGLAGNPILAEEAGFFDTVLHGRGAMPAWGTVLNVQEVADIHAWLKTLK